VKYNRNVSLPLYPLEMNYNDALSLSQANRDALLCSTELCWVYPWSWWYGCPYWQPGWQRWASIDLYIHCIMSCILLSMYRGGHL